MRENVRMRRGIMSVYVSDISTTRFRMNDGIPASGPRSRAEGSPHAAFHSGGEETTGEPREAVVSAPNSCFLQLGVDKVATF